MTQPEGAAQEPVLPDAQGMRLWLDKAVAWGTADSPDTQRDVCLHMGRLKGFLLELLTHINKSSTTDVMKRLPFLGQFLGRLCWNPYVTADATSRRLLFQCLWGLHSEHPDNAVERKANQWIRKVFCQLATEEDDSAAQVLMKHMDIPPKEYHRKVLTKMVAKLQEDTGKSCDSLGNMKHRCSCERILATSEACVPLVTCPEAAPLMGSLLRQPVTCSRAALSLDFIQTLSSSLASGSLSLDEQAVFSLWYQNMPCLEDATLSLLESVLMDTGSTPLRIKQQVAQSLLPKACAQHCSIFLVINDIFRSILKQTDGRESVKYLIQTFTSCFLMERALMQHQTSVSLKALFPQSPQSLLVPLLILPSEMPEQAWRRHLTWLSASLQTLTEQEEEDDSSSTRVFEAWFLVVQCSYWVQVAVQLLVTSGPEDDGGPLLWLLTFYQHPTNRGHYRAQQLVKATKAWDHLRSLFSVPAAPLPVDRLQSTSALLAPQATQQPCTAPASIGLHLLVNSAVFCQQSLSGSTEILQTVLGCRGLVDEAAFVLGSLELRLNGEGRSPGDDSSSSRVHLRIQALQNTLAPMHTAPSPAERQALQHHAKHNNAHNGAPAGSSSSRAPCAE